MSREMVKLIHADGFFPPGDAEKYSAVVQGLNFVEKEYGYELENFNMILPNIEPILSKVLGERISVDGARSGIFRKPISNLVHFESFDSLNEWCFIVALEKTTLNLHYHLSTPGDGEVSGADAWSALDGYKFNYRNIFEWNIHTNIVLRPNQGVFFRPWVFHSLEDGLVQYYRLISDKKFRILVVGLPGSSRKEIAALLKSHINNSKILTSKDIRVELKDIDYSYEGRMRQTYRILNMARRCQEDVVIIDMVCPTIEMRSLINPDILIWADDIEKSTHQEVDKIFENPVLYDFRFKNLKDIDIENVINRIKAKRF